MSRQRAMLWGLETALVTKTTQDAIEAVHEATPRLIGMIEERGEVIDALTTICELLGLDAGFLEGDENDS